MSSGNVPNNEVLMKRIEALERQLNEQASLEQMQKEGRGALSKERQIEAIFQGLGRPTIVPDKGLQYPKHIPHPTRQGHYDRAKDGFHEQQILERFAAEAESDRAAEPDTVEVAAEHTPPVIGYKRRGRPAKKAGE